MWMGAVRMIADKNITIIHSTPVHQLTSGEDKSWNKSFQCCGLLVDYCDVFISCLDSFWWHPFTAERLFLSAVWTHSDGTHSLQNIHFYQLFRLILTAPIHCRASIFISCLDSFWRQPIHCRTSIFISCLDSFWRHPFTAGQSIFISCLDSFWRQPIHCRTSILSAVWTHSDGTHSLQNIHFYQLFGLILTAPIHCRTSIFISCLDSFWRHPFTAEHLILSAVWTHSDGTHSLQSIYFYQLFGLILTAPIHCRASIFISCLDSFWRHPFTAEHPFLSAVWTHSDGTHSLQNIYFYQLFGLILTAPIHCRTSIFIMVWTLEGFALVLLSCWIWFVWWLN